VTFLELWEAMMAIDPVAAQYAAARRSPTAASPCCAPARVQARSRDTRRCRVAVVDFFTAVAAASGNQVLASRKHRLKSIARPALTRMIDRVPQARARIQDAQGKIARHQTSAQRASAHLDGEAHPRFQTGTRARIDQPKGDR